MSIWKTNDHKAWQTLLIISVLWALLFAVAIFAAFMISSASGEVQHPEVTQDNLTAFLSNDTTDHHVFNPGPINWYKCGHFASDLATNASLQNISLGTAILKSDFDRNYHVVNYAYVDDELLFIEPQLDQIYTTFNISNRWFCSAMLIPWRTAPITWVLWYEADVWF